MSFRARLTLFFSIIVVIPMIAVALVLFRITGDSETGKSDARLAAGLQTALILYDDARDRAQPLLARVARDRSFQTALSRGRRRALRTRLERLRAQNPQIASIALYALDGRLRSRAGSSRTVAPATAAPTSARGRRLGTLAVSVTTAREFARTVERFTQLDARVFAGGRHLASTLPEREDGAPRSGEHEIAGKEYRGRFLQIREAAGGTVQIGVFQQSEGLEDSIRESRLLIGGVLLAFLLLSLASSVFVVRALQGQVDQFLQAARRLGRGDFSRQVPVEGDDEFAALGTEFNTMAEQLAAKIEEVESSRRELEGAIRRVGDAFAAGLDRQGIVDLLLRTAVDACAADAGRAIPLDHLKMRPARVGMEEAALAAAFKTAERRAFEVRPEDGPELMALLDGTDVPVEGRGVARGQSDGAYSFAAPIRARLGAGTSVEYVGVISIARRGHPFSDAEFELFGYLASQAAVSIENADLHEVIQREAVTDELTGLSNWRRFHEFLDAELERSRRFGSDVGLVMLDIDDFKLVNDTFGHEQGNAILSELGRVLIELSRDIDLPARYGGEELAVVLPQTGIDGARQLAERMRAAIERVAIKRIESSQVLRVTASFGVCSLLTAGVGSAADKERLISAADTALFRAKKAGKNRVESC